MQGSADEFIHRKQLAFKLDREKDKSVSTIDIARKGAHLWKRVAWTFMKESDYAEKVFLLERFEWAGQTGEVTGEGRTVGKMEYRFGYFIVGKNGKAAGHWVWGQYCPLVPAGDLWNLLALARKEGTLVGDLPAFS